MDGVEPLRFDVAKIGLENIAFDDQPTLGFPVFWTYDILFHMRNSRLGFYKRAL
eukprot:CAMPEP_0203791190 /NCGR_PEP_ID=MMETSP0100_2-20121128/4483_1 /ASSEMBLY_ACC=CAM_ASM_000210 /TAXON_ID=96639 /ORGANISM=" , Strain NY0313808BC1" /LENGTH=53 /DNA_ID=CAMNT_0050694453 /DNA_START=63 /DNA_END=224 /DNA_ORIENTATION=-